MFFPADSDAGQRDGHFDLHIGGSLASGKGDRKPVSIKYQKLKTPKLYLTAKIPLAIGVNEQSSHESKFKTSRRAINFFGRLVFAFGAEDFLFLSFVSSFVSWGQIVKSPVYQTVVEVCIGEIDATCLPNEYLLALNKDKNLIDESYWVNGKSYGKAMVMNDTLDRFGMHKDS